ncbi:ECF RNA polymerase sigma factor SigK [Occultella aeris]|uniref:ECF RNA polymerase sigma factor SigK n=1 Tax=Occultella aeris TaxID=2761496 RepID=A0A7M4DIC4_9MICO|nr:ECF RNA polymerase sigma factor SigK [Occultella aeris]VZO36696.1 ECF RNA polymerase sigma factor SigK [Occultella aeris]
MPEFSPETPAGGERRAAAGRARARVGPACGALRDTGTVSNQGPGLRGTTPGATTGSRDQLGVLMQRAAAGDQDAFATIYDATAPVVHGVARRVLRDPDLAAEVTQEVMLEAWRTASRFDGARGSVMAWLTTMTRRRAVDRVRSEQSHRDRDERVAAGDFRRPFDEVAETAERRAEVLDVHRCLDSLTDLQRDAVVTAFYGGQTYREVAQSRGASLPTVKSRIRDGLNRLRRCLDGMQSP